MGPGFQTSDYSPHAVECELIEDGGAFVAHRPTDRGPPPPRGSWGGGAVLVDGDEPDRFDQVTTGRDGLALGAVRGLPMAVVRESSQPVAGEIRVP